MNETIGSLELEFLINNPELLQQLRQTERNFQQTNRNIQQSMNQNASAFEGYAKKAAVAAASYFSLTAVKGFTAELIAVRGEFEQLNVAYSTILRSKEKGDALFQETIKTAATTPFNLTEVAQSTKQLLAYGTAAGEITNTITMLGNVASGVSAPLNDIVYLYGTLQTQGRAYTKDIQQFTGRGIPIIAELAKQFETTESQVAKLVEEGRVGFPEIKRAFESMTGSAGIFYNLMEKQSKTLTGQLANLQDAWAMMLNEIGEANQGALSGGIQAAATLVAHYQDVLDILGLLVVAYGAYKAAVMAQTAVQIINQEITLQQALAGRELTAVQGLQAVAARALSGAQLSLNRLLQSGTLITAGLTASITLLVGGIYAWHKASEVTESLQNAINDTRAESAKKLEEEKLKLSELLSVLRSNTSSYEEKASAIKRLNELNPEYLGGLTQQNALTKEGTELINNYLNALNSKLEGEAAYAAKLKNLQEITDLKSRGISAVDNSEAIGRSLKYAANGDWMWSRDDVNKRIVEDKITELTKANEAIDKTFSKQLKQRATGVTSGMGETDAIKRAKQFAADLAKPLENFDKLLKTAVGKGDFESVKKALEDQSAKLTATLGPDEKQISQINKRVARVKEILAKYDPEKQAKSGTDMYSAEQRRLDMLNRIYQLNEKYNAQSMDDSNAKLEAIRLDYAKLKTDIEKYNANPKNKKKINTDTLDASRFAAQKNQADLNENKLIEDDLAKKKSLYEDYEQARQLFGTTTAKALYADLLKSGASFQEFLGNMLGSVTENTDLTEAAFQERKKAVSAAFDDEKRNTENNYLQLLADNQTYEQKRRTLQENAIAKLDELRQKGNYKEAETLRKKSEDELTELDKQHVQQLQSYTDLFDNVDRLSTASLRKGIANLKSEVNKLSLTPKAKEFFDKLFADMDRKAESQSANDWKGIASSLGEAARAAGALDANLGQALGVAANLAAQVGNIKQGISDFKAAKKGGDVLGQITSGLGIFGSVVSIFSSVFSLFDGSKRAAEQMRHSQELQLKATEAVTKALERQFGLIKEVYGTERLIAYTKQLKDIAAAQADLQTTINGKFSFTGNKVIDDYLTKLNNGDKSTFFNFGEAELNKIRAAVGLTGKSIAELQTLLDKGLLDETTGKLVQSLLDLEQQAKAVRNALTEEITGVNYDGLTDKIRSVFDSGEVAAKNFADAIETSIQGAFSNAFKRKEIEERMQPFYDALYKAGADGSFSSDEIKTLRDMRDKIAQELADRAKAYEQIIGSDPAQNKANTLEGSVRASLTEETGSIIAGTLRGIQLAAIKVQEYSGDNGQTMRDQLVEIRRQTLLQMQIAANTKRTADNTDVLPLMRDSLKSIDKNTSDTSGNILRAAGLTGKI